MRYAPEAIDNSRNEHILKVRFPTAGRIIMKPLALYRKEKSLSQSQLSEEITRAGIKISPASVALYETGKRQPPLAKARAIAQFFGVATDDIEYGKLDRGE